jgi:lysophospholipase L1-like esterase
VNRKTHFPTVAAIFSLLLTAVAGSGAEISIIPKLKQGQHVNISAIGTSLTAPDCSSWFGEMGAWLNAQYPGLVTLDNEGISGSASSHTSWYASDVSGLGVQLPAALNHNPDAIFIEFAINDASTDVGISPALSKQNLQTMIDRIKAWATSQNKSVDIIVQTMNNEPLSGLRPNLATYYQGYREVAAANGVALIDHYPSWLDLYNSEADHARWFSYVPDHVHPGPLGTEKLILPEIERAMMTQTPEPGTLPLLGTPLCLLLAYAWRKRR